MLNDAGQTAFRADLTGSGVGSTNNQGVWSEGSGSLALVARTGSQAPGGGKLRYGPSVELFSPLEQRRSDRVLWRPDRRQRGTLVGRLRQLGTGGPRGEPAPGTPAGVNFSFAPFLPELCPRLSDPAKAEQCRPDRVCWLPQRQWNGHHEQLGRVVERFRQPGAGGPRWDPAAGTPSGVNYDFGPVSFALNDAGQTTFWANLAGSGVVDTKTLASGRGRPAI